MTEFLYLAGEPALSTRTTLTIKVYAASTPNFTQVVYESDVTENIPISSAVTTVSATSPNGNKIIYSIVDGDPNSEFTVHFSTGGCDTLAQVGVTTNMELISLLAFKAIEKTKSGQWKLFVSHLCVHFQ